jgi:D-amino peptidase
MNVYVSVDIEGISGVVHGDMMMAGEKEYHRGRALMTAETNAVVEGLVQAGAEYILVNDSHGPMRNILIEDLHPAAHLVMGSGDAKEACQLEGADEGTFDAAVLVGYHAMAKARPAIHPHTIAGIAVAELRINGRPVGETGLNAGVLGSLGIPTVMASGDQTTMAEARDFLGDTIQTVTVKQARGRNAAICRPPSATKPELTEAAKKALTERANVPLYKPEQPWRLELDLNTLAQAERASRTAGVERIASQTFVLHGDTPWEQYKTLWASLRSALYEPASWLA